jgi:hypothetical protein
MHLGVVDRRGRHHTLSGRSLTQSWHRGRLAGCDSRHVAKRPPRWCGAGAVRVPSCATRRLQFGCIGVAQAQHTVARASAFASLAAGDPVKFLGAQMTCRELLLLICSWQLPKLSAAAVRTAITTTACKAKHLQQQTHTSRAICSHDCSPAAHWRIRGASWHCSATPAARCGQRFRGCEVLRRCCCCSRSVSPRRWHAIACLHACQQLLID